MNPDPFEQHLQRRVLPHLPPEWRAEILGAAAAAREEQERAETPAHGMSWKHIRWGALAAVWVTIGCISSLEPAQESKTAVAHANPAVLQEQWQEHLRLVSELTELPEMQTPLPPPPPRSGCRPTRMKIFA